MDAPNQLRIGFGPDTLQFDVDVNGPGNVLSLDRATLQAELSASELLPYGEVLEGVLTGDPLLSVRADTAEDCWRILAPVLKSWAAGHVPLEEYPAGTPGRRAGRPRFVAAGPARIRRCAGADQAATTQQQRPGSNDTAGRIPSQVSGPLCQCRVNAAVLLALAAWSGGN